MNFFKKAQAFAASSTPSNEDAAPATQSTPSDGGFGSFLQGQASSLLNSQTNTTTTAPPSDQTPVAGEGATPVALPGGRQAPTTQELMAGTQLLFGAAQGQQVENTKLAGAAADLLGGLAISGKLDQTQYSTYVNQAEDYLNKYSQKDTPVAPVGDTPAGAAAPPATALTKETPATDVTANTEAPGAADPALAPAEETTAPTQAAGEEDTSRAIDAPAPVYAPTPAAAAEDATPTEASTPAGAPEQATADEATAPSPAASEEATTSNEEDIASTPDASQDVTTTNLDGSPAAVADAATNLADN